VGRFEKTVRASPIGANFSQKLEKQQQNKITKKQLSSF